MFTGGWSTKRLAAVVAIAGVTLAAVVLLTLRGVGTGVTTACPAATDANWNPYDGTAAQATACGLIVYPLTAVTTLPDGGHRYTYQEPGNVATYRDIPPLGFNALTASAAERALYGLPPKPPTSNSIALAHWVSEMSGIKTWVPPTSFEYSVPGTS